MQGLHVYLFVAFKRNEARGRPCCRLGNRFGISVIILLCLDVGLHILRRHQPQCVSLDRENPS